MYDWFSLKKSVYADVKNHCIQRASTRSKICLFNLQFVNISMYHTRRVSVLRTNATVVSNWSWTFTYSIWAILLTALYSYLILTKLRRPFFDQSYTCTLRTKCIQTNVVVQQEEHRISVYFQFVSQYFRVNVKINKLFERTKYYYYLTENCCSRDIYRCVFTAA